MEVDAIACERGAEVASAEAARQSGLFKASQANLIAYKHKLANADAELEALRAEFKAQLEATQVIKIKFRDEILSSMLEIEQSMQHILNKPELAVHRLSTSAQVQLHDTTSDAAGVKDGAGGIISLKNTRPPELVNGNQAEVTMKVNQKDED